MKFPETVLQVNQKILFLEGRSIRSSEENREYSSEIFVNKATSYRAAVLSREVIREDSECRIRGALK